ncbi:MAG: HEPN domain-containing protein [Thermoproteota archaeon]
MCKVLSGLNEEHRKYFSNIFTTRIRIIRIARDWFEEGYPRFIDRFEPPSWIDKDEIDKYKNEWFMDVRIPPTIFFQKVWKMRIEDLAKEIVQSVVDAILLLTRADARLSSIHILDGIMGYSWVHLGRYVSSQDIYRINVREVASIRSELSKKIRQIFAPKEVIISPKQITLNYNIDLALDFYRAGTMKSVAHEKLIDWCIALEALFTDSHQEIARKLQERVSILIGRSDKEVAEISELIKKCYDIRSKIIHGDPKWKKEPLDVLLDKLQDYTRRSIHACRKLAGPRGYDSKEDLLDMLDKALLHTRERKALWKRLSRGHLG